MSITRVDSYSDLKNRLLVTGGVGAAAGATYTLTQKSWLNNDKPSDSFVKNVSDHLEKKVSPKEKKEATLINNFVKQVVDPVVDVDTLKPQIKASEELSEAIKATPEEEIDAAIERVFSNPDKSALKDELVGLQEKTSSNNKFGRNSALKLIHENYDAKTQTLKQSEKTSDDVFRMLKKTANKIQVKSAIVGGIVVGLASAAIATVLTDVENPHK